MKNNPCIHIGHLKIIDHLILGICDLSLKKGTANLSAINFETCAMNSWDQVIDSLVCGEINGAFIPAPIAMNLFAQGLDIRILMFAHKSGSLIAKSTGSDIKTIADFKGKTILVSSELSIQTMLLHKLFSSAGLTFGDHNDLNTDVTCEAVPPMVMIEMLTHDLDKDIGGYAVEEPFASYGIQQGVAKKICTSTSLWKNHPCCVFVLNQKFITTYPEAVQKVLSLFLQTGKQIQKTKSDEISAMAQKFCDQKISLIQQIFTQTDLSFNPDSLIPDINALEMIQNYMADTMKVLKNKVDLSVLVDRSIISNLISGS
ncbi:MAG: ABC transporter substrate-binding protein [Pseudomonadota bacterium]